MACTVAAGCGHRRSHRLALLALCDLPRLPANRMLRTLGVVLGTPP